MKIKQNWIFLNKLQQSCFEILVYAGKTFGEKSCLKYLLFLIIQKIYNFYVSLMR